MIPRPVLEAVPAIPARSQERPQVAPGKQPGPVTPERLTEFYAADLAQGRVPSKRQIKRDWPVGYDAASDLHDHLTAAMAPPDPELPGLALNRQEEPPGRGHRLATSEGGPSWPTVCAAGPAWTGGSSCPPWPWASAWPSSPATAGGHGIAAVTTRAVVPDGSAYTPSSWAVALLSAGGWPQTACNLGAITAWEAAEGGNWENTARYNPLDTTEPEPGSWPMNSVNVQAYTSWQEGFTATLATLGNGDYGGILSALSAGDSAQAVADAVAGSPWGTGSFTATC